MAVQNHGEELGMFMQRRVNFLISALGSLNPTLEKAAETIDVEVEITPYIIDNIDDKVKTAVSAVQGGVWSQRDGIIFAGNAARVDETIKEINEEQKKQQKNASGQTNS